MRLQGKTFVVFVILLFTTPLFGQSFYNYNSRWKDWDDWDRWGWDVEFDRPFIELNYGIGEPKHENIYGDFSKVGLIELKLGYLKESSFYYDNIDDRSESFVFGSKLATSLKSNGDAANEFRTTLWRFGFGTRNTLGYYWDKVSLLPYTQDGFVWSRLETDDSKMTNEFSPIPLSSIDPNVMSNFQIIERYRDAFRFGTVNEGGVRLELAEMVSFNVGYEAAVIFPRHLFWKHAGSFIIEKAGQGALSYFIDEILDSSPIAGPIVNFILQNGYSYAFYSLKKKDMNWPFTTEAPLTYETFKFGMTFTF